MDARTRLATQLYADPRITDPRWADWLLACVEHETKKTYKPIQEQWNGDRYKYFEGKYGYRTTLGQSLGNLYPGDGVKYAGRGHVQITGRGNYFRFGKVLGVNLIEKPERALEWDISYEILVRGSLGLDGLFYRKPTYKLSAYINKTTCDWYNARKVIIAFSEAQKKVAVGIADAAVANMRLRLAACERLEQEDVTVNTEPSPAQQPRLSDKGDLAVPDKVSQREARLDKTVDTNSPPVTIENKEQHDVLATFSASATRDAELVRATAALWQNYLNNNGRPQESSNIESQAKNLLNVDLGRPQREEVIQEDQE